MSTLFYCDNYFWLAPGETELSRNNMSGLNLITKPPVAGRSDLIVRVSAWNAPALEVRPR